MDDKKLISAGPPPPAYPGNSQNIGYIPQPANNMYPQVYSKEAPPSYPTPAQPAEQPGIISLPEIIVNPHHGTAHLDDDNFKSFDFTDRSVRRAFVRKVFGLLFSQLMLTVAIVAVFMYHQPLQRVVHENMWILYVAIGVYISTAIAILCCEGPRRRVPYNYIFLFTFTIALSVMVGVALAGMEPRVVMMAAGITAAIVFGLTVFAFQTKWDFTLCSGFIFCFFLVVLIMGIVVAITRDIQLYYLYHSLGVLLFSFYLVYDIQLIIDGDHKYKLSPEEYVFAALCIYLDIINIFLRILRMMR